MLARRNTKKNDTRGKYVEYLNGLSPHPESPNWIMAGKHRRYYAHRELYGTALRKYDPIAFEVGYQDWKRGNR